MPSIKNLSTRDIADVLDVNLLLVRGKDSGVPSVAYLRNVVEYNKLEQLLDSRAIDSYWSLETLKDGRFQELYRNY